jgi:two-component system response regulator AtoC
MKVLIVDDEKNIRDSLRKYLSLEDIDSSSAENGEKALALLENEQFDAVILDLKLPGMSGQEILEWINVNGLSTPVIMISAHGEISDAVNALKSGAKDYLTKPFDPDELIIKLKGLVENKRRENIIEANKRTAPKENSLIGESPAMKTLSHQIDKIANTDVTVLITGESGTGKEVVAKEIHKRGARNAEPFIAVNIGGIHESLMESELFGHEKGSFTGALSRKIGLFELAGSGTLFLDEIGEMPMALQVKLLRVLQERKIRRLGGTSDIPVNARIISATNKDVESIVKEEKFREDLYYRLNVFRINLPPLRERSEDILLLAKYLLEKSAARITKSSHYFSKDAEKKLLAYSYPGNIRELENILERTLIYCEGNEIKPEDIDLHQIPGMQEELIQHQTKDDDKTDAVDSSFLENRSLEDIEKKAIQDALSRCGGNRTKAAEELGVSRKTIINKIKFYELE